MIAPLTAARAACEMRDWQISNLELQKILYLAHMVHLGRTGEPLVPSLFEAWDYGPVLPEVYRQAKAFGSVRVRNVFHRAPQIDREGTEYQALANTIDSVRDFSPSDLVATTHWSEGAWASVYAPKQRGIKIPNDKILEEYRARLPKS